MEEIIVDGPNLIIAAAVVLWIGQQLTKVAPLLEKYSIPIAVTGGLMCSILVAIVAAAGGPKITFDMEMRDTLLIVFFATVGVSAKFSRLKAGGAALGKLVVCAAVFLLIQDVTGVLLAMAFKAHPAYGLFAGSVSLAGGHGTAIAWGQEASAAGVEGADIIGIAFATFGLVAGGIIGGPVAERLIKRDHLSPAKSEASASDEPTKHDDLPFMKRAGSVMIVLAVCLSLGEVVNQWLFSNDIKLPGFLTAMMVGIAITNLADRTKKPLIGGDFDKVGEISLQFFLAMSLMSMDLSAIAGSFTTILIVLFVQMVVLAIFAAFVIYRVMGKDYDAAVIVGGFCGLAMGATPVAMANMNAITAKYGPSFKAFLVVPLVGAFFVDILNALVIKFFIGLPFMQQAAGV